MKEKKSVWYRIGYNLGGTAFILGIFFGTAFYQLSLWYSIFIIGNSIEDINLLEFSILGFVIFLVGYIYAVKINNFWLDEKELEKEIKKLK